MIGIKATVSCQVSAGPHCNYYTKAGLSLDLDRTCRFCVTNNQGGYSCMLYNEVLQATGVHSQTKRHSAKGAVINKCHRCLSAMITKSTSAIEDSADSDNKVAIVQEFLQMVEQIKAQGIPQAMAEQGALQAISGRDKI